MNRSILAAVVAVSLNTHAEEWRYWTWTGEARMGAISGRTAWFATSGGVLEWNLDANTSKLHQRNDGLPSTNLVSIVSQSDGSIWTVSDRGDLAVKRPNASFWESKGTYTSKPSPWSFNPRAMVMHHNSHTGRDVLVMGGPQGLSFFPADANVALDWTDQFGSLGKREVRSISISGDTIWVGLMGGMASIIPPWDSLGNNRAFVSDPKRWTALAKSEETDAYNALFPTPTGMNWYSAFSYAAKDILLSQQGLYWKGTLYSATGIANPLGQAIYPVHALDIGTGLLISSACLDVPYVSKGPMLLTPDGKIRLPPAPSNSFPVPPPPVITMKSGGIFGAWSTNRIFEWRKGQSTWTSPWTDGFSKGNDPYGMNFSMIDADKNSLTFGPNQSIWAGTWGPGLWGATLPSSGTSDSLTWNDWNPSKSCLEGFQAGTDFTAIGVLTSTDSAVWGVEYSKSLSSDSMILFQKTTIASDPLHCFKFLGKSDAYTSGMLVRNQRIWIATQKGVFVLRQPSQNAQTAAQIFVHADAFARRLGAMTVGDQAVILALTPGEILAFPENASKDTVLASSLYRDTLIGNAASKVANITARQKWNTFALDAVGHIWAAGSEGIDILSLENNSGVLGFRKIRELNFEDGLPSNNVYNLAIDGSTGSALIATDAGLGYWTSPYRPLPASLETGKARVWPNPLRTRTHKELVVDGATESSEFFLNAADGSLVVHLNSNQQNGGYFRWPVPAPDKLRPGVYRWTLRDGSKKVGGPLLIAE